MTFSEIQTEVADRLGITASGDLTRLGRLINHKHREITTSIGIKTPTRRSTATAAPTAGFSTLTFSSVEKVIDIYNRNVSPYKQLQEVTLDELRAEMPFETSDLPTRWALQSATATAQVILLNVVFSGTPTFHAEVYGLASTLSGSNTPLFPESFHDILTSAVLADEYMKQEKPALARIEYERVHGPVGRPELGRLAQLRHWYAVSLTKEIYQGKTNTWNGARVQVT